MQAKKITIRLSEEEIMNLQKLREVVFRDSNTDCGVIKYLINNFLDFSILMKSKNAALEEEIKKNRELTKKITNFKQALKELSV